MARLEQDTRIVQKLDQENRREHEYSYRASLHEDWQIWFPNGGYMAALLLRAVGEASDFSTPISQTCYFLSVPKLGEVDIEVKRLKKTRNAEALSFSMSQQGKPIIHGLAWTGESVDGYEHDDAEMPLVSGPDKLAATTNISGAHPPGAFWQHFEQRPISGDVHWLQKESGKAQQLDWLCFNQDEGASGNEFVDAGRLVVLLDTYGWPAAARAHCGDGRFIAPTLSLTVDFHRPCGGGWMLSESTAPVAQSGYMNSRNRLWAQSGELLATSQAQLMCRPRPGMNK